ncbi:MAG TPA: hypothetical protein VFJ30_01200 [Phycisphaerae bacterium]|nr:hypothetical protein [Phycisphaerae bacterium]
MSKALPYPQYGCITALDILQHMIRVEFRIEVPNKIFTPGHSTPLRFAWDCLTRPGEDVAVWSCRSGGKTLTASIVAAMELGAVDGLQVRVLSGSEAQARCLYEYWRRWCGGFLSRRVRGHIGASLTAVGGGRMEILAASQRRVRGPKVHRLYADELDEIDPHIERAAVGMIASGPDIPASTRYMSTWHRIDGPMGKLIDGIPGNGVRLHKWNIWEAIAACPPDRHQNGAGCDVCPLEPACRAKAREFHTDPDWRIGIAADADGLCAIDDVIKAYRKAGAATWAAEYECRRPSIEGLVYPEFDEGVHRAASAPAALTIYRSVDWGFNTFVCLWLGEDPEGVVYLLDTYKAGRTRLKVHADAILAHRLRQVRATYCDPAGRSRNDQTGRSNVEEFRAYGIECTYSLSSRAREVANGVRLVRAALKPASGPVRFRYVDTASNRAFVRDIQSYRNRRVNDTYVDEPVDPQPAEHTMDALRYFYVNRMGGRSVQRVGLRTS